MSDPYPEHTRMSLVLDKSQAIGEFLEWLQTEGLVICAWDGSNGEYFPTGRTLESQLAEYFKVDLVKIESEKRAMLDANRTVNGHLVRPGEVG